MRLIVVRHGTAKSKRTWQGRDVDRPLTGSGVRQAKVMAARLARYRPVKVISSPSLRCTQTLEPLARGRLRVQRTDALAPDAGASAIDLVHKQIKTASADATVVLCTHREVLVELLPVLAKESGVSLGHRPPGAKGSYWTLVFDGEKLVSVKYSRPSG